MFVVDAAAMRQIGRIRASGPVYCMAIFQADDRLFLSTCRARGPQGEILEVADTRTRTVISTTDGPDLLLYDVRSSTMSVLDSGGTTPLAWRSTLLATSSTSQWAYGFEEWERLL